MYAPDGKPTGEKVERSYAHKKGILHAAVHIYVYRKTDKGYDVLLQKRAADKDSFPLCWDTSCAGHVTSGDTFEKTVVKELCEELGIKVSEGEAVHCFTETVRKVNTFYGKVFDDREIYKVYKLEYDVPAEKIEFQKEEISEVKWMNSEKLLEKLEANDKDYCIMKDTYKKALEYIKTPLG